VTVPIEHVIPLYVVQLLWFVSLQKLIEIVEYDTVW
jgi:hypothetical protein